MIMIPVPRSLLLMLMLTSLTVSLTACGDEDIPQSISVNITNLEFPATGGNQVLIISTNASSWQISSDSDWVILSSSSGTSPKAIVTVVVNTLAPEPRAGKLIITAGNALPVEVTVSQAASDYLFNLSVTPASLSIPMAGGNASFRLNSTAGSWTINSSAGWLTVNRSSGTENSLDITVTALPNATVGPRDATLTISAAHARDVIVTVSQTGPRYPSYNTNPLPPDATGMGRDALDLARAISAGWNLGNSLEATGSETAWGNPRTTMAIIEMVKAAGFNAIRVPVSWNQYANQQTARISDAWMARVKEVVDFGLANNLYVIINIHWDGGWLENNVTPERQEAVNMRQRAFWEQIATHFRDYDERLIFSGANEPNARDATAMGVLMSYMQTFIDAVRSTGGRNHYRNLVVQGPLTDIALTWNLMHSMPRDVVANRLMVAVHYYTPWTFCGLAADADWGRAAWFWGEPFRNEPLVNGINRVAATGEQEVLDLFGRMKTRFVDKGIPVILGEYGVINRSNLITDPAARARHNQSRAYFLEFVTRQMKNHGMVPFIWDNGHISPAGGVGDNSFALFNRHTRSVIDQAALDAIIRGAAAGVYPF